MTFLQDDAIPAFAKWNFRQRKLNILWHLVRAEFSSEPLNKPDLLFYAVSAVAAPHCFPPLSHDLLMS
jgi:hypothetical protein